MDSMFDMSEVFDASELFWEFIESLIDNTYDKLICTDVFHDFAQGIQSQNSLGLKLDSVLFSENDATLLHLELDQHPYYDDTTHYFVFRHIGQLLREVEQLYHNIIMTPIHYSQAHFDCVQSYTGRYELMKRCIRKIQGEIMTQESENLLENLRL